MFRTSVVEAGVEVDGVPHGAMIFLDKGNDVAIHVSPDPEIPAPVTEILVSRSALERILSAESAAE